MMATANPTGDPVPLPLSPGAAQLVAETLGYRYEPAERDPAEAAAVKAKLAEAYAQAGVIPPDQAQHLAMARAERDRLLCEKSPTYAAAIAEIADLREKLATHDGPKRRDHDAAVHAEIRVLRDEIARLAPNLGNVGLDEMRSIVDQARRVVAADFPMQDRCGCAAGQVPHYEPVQFHRRGSDQCRAEQ